MFCYINKLMKNHLIWFEILVIVRFFKDKTKEKKLPSAMLQNKRQRHSCDSK